MERIKVFMFGKQEPQKRFIRDNKGRPYYLKKLSFPYRYPRTFVIGGGTLFAMITFSGPIYHAIFTNPADHPPEYFMWPREKAMGMTYLEQWKRKYGKPEDRSQ